MVTEQKDRTEQSINMCISSEGANNDLEDLTHTPEMKKGEKITACLQT
jgi:hypothetical protein